MFKRGLLVGLAVLAAMGCGVLLLSHMKYSGVVRRMVAEGPLYRSTKIYSAARVVSVGDPATVEELVADLRASGSDYRVTGNRVELLPGPVITLAAGRVAAIEAGGPVERCELPPRLLAHIRKGMREKQQTVRFDEIPPVLVGAVLSVEDKRFFEHPGWDPLRLLAATWVDLRTGRRAQGGSTLSMQLARTLFLSPEKRMRRKLTEMLLTIQLERNLSKQQIFEAYANQVYLGRRGNYSIHGFAECAQTLFHKRLREITLEEAALMAGMIQRPSYFDPFKHPERAMERRNVVLALMRRNGVIGEAEREQAASAGLGLTPWTADDSEAAYFLDYVDDELDRAAEEPYGAGSVYTTLDLNLQRAANEAVRVGMAEVDGIGHGLKTQGIRQPQVALVALDPATGAVKAMVGGRDYRETQLNRALAARQPGSVFKPFVYAAAIESRQFTAASRIEDAPTAFAFGSQVYRPGNYHEEFLGTVTLRRALAQSANNATVRLAEQVGYDRVLALARRAGMGDGLRATPSMALGSYEATPLEVAEAYSTFVNRGVRVGARAVAQVRTKEGTVVYTAPDERRPVLDARAASVMVAMLEEVLRTGTGSGAWARGLHGAAAGKTGTSRDAWFAGFTPKLVVVVWVGMDDGKDVGLSGARAALPIWTEFLKRAAQYGPYREAGGFDRPAGVVEVPMDEDAGCARPDGTVRELFVEGTEPGACEV